MLQKAVTWPCLEKNVQNTTHNTNYNDVTLDHAQWSGPFDLPSKTRTRFTVNLKLVSTYLTWP